MANELHVWLQADLVGTLTMAAGKLRFAYHPAWLARPTAVALSNSLPLRGESFDDQECRPFFAGLLPEGRLRQQIARQSQVSAQNDFALLDVLGGECAGAITFLPAGQKPPTSDQGSVEWLDDERLMRLLDELPYRPMLAGVDGMRLSLAGAQDKLPVVFDGRRIGLPKGGYPSTHILKPPIRDIADSVRNEAFCLALAAAMKIKAATASIHVIGTQQVLLVDRYDRREATDGVLPRIPQEDFCQALSVAPEMKYQNEGGPGLAACFGLLRKLTRPSAPQILHLLDYVILNALLGNHDAHAKNFSLLYSVAAPELAPLYDVLCTVVYPGLSPKMAMKLGSKYLFDDVMPKHWDQFADDAGLSRAQTRKRVMQIATAMPTAATQLRSAAPFADQPVIDSIMQLIAKRCELTVRRLADKKA